MSCKIRRMVYKCTTNFFHFGMFFVHLRVNMRRMPMKISAIALVIWYFVSIVGFGIHTCSTTQRTFLTSFISGMTCEDIHPEDHCEESHHCSDKQCCSHHSEECEDCEDDFMALSITGTAHSSESDSFIGCHHGLAVCEMPVYESISISSSNPEVLKILLQPDSGFIVPGDVQSYLAIWRI